MKQQPPTRSILIEARSRLERGWTQGVHAKNAAGDTVYVSDPSAVSYCATGALMAAAKMECPSIMDIGDLEAYRLLSAGLPGTKSIAGLQLFNDDPGRRQNEVLALFDSAIQRCQS